MSGPVFTKSWHECPYGHFCTGTHGDAARAVAPPVERCAECGVPFAEHPDTDACAIRNESRPPSPDPVAGLREALSQAVQRAGLYEIADAMTFAILDGTFADATEEQVRHAVYELVGRALLDSGGLDVAHADCGGRCRCFRRGAYNPSLDEALNSGDGTYRP